MTPLTRQQVASLAGISLNRLTIAVRENRMGIARAVLDYGGKVQLFDSEHPAIVKYIAARQAAKAATAAKEGKPRALPESR